MRRRVTEKIIKMRPVIALVNSSLPFLTCSALSPPVMIWIVATSIITSEIPPATPAKNLRRVMVKPLVSTLKQPRAVSMAVSPQLPLGLIFTLLPPPELVVDVGAVELKVERLSWLMSAPHSLAALVPVQQ